MSAGAPQQLVIPKTQRAKRALKALEPKIVETVKKSLILRGPKTSETVSVALRDLHKMKSPDSALMAKKNVTRPFEDGSSVEFLSRANHSGLFAFGSHSKKRPCSLIFGRTFDGTLLDMLEFNLDAKTFMSMNDFEGKRKAVVRYNSKPLFVFNGEAFDSSEDFKTAKNLLVDFFRGEVLPKINLVSLDHVIVCTAVKDTIHFRHYGVLMKKSGSKLPRVELDEVGPRMDLQFRRRKQAPEAVVKESLKVPKAAKPPKKKNISRSEFGEKLGRLHMKPQDLAKIAVTKPKALQGGKRKRRDAADGEETQPRAGPGGFGTRGAPRKVANQKANATDDAAQLPSAKKARTDSVKKGGLRSSTVD